MTIQWFPGHMNKAKRQVQEMLKFVDIVFVLVDARLPLSSRNPLLDKILNQKPRLILLNKADLADKAQTKKWQEYFEKQGFGTLMINAKDGVGIKKIVPKSKEVLHEKLEREKSRGMKERAIRAMVIGIPNVGKSTLLNKLVGKKVAQVGNKPGVTKGQQWLRHDKNLELLDTPGILWPKFEDQTVAKKLALTGAIKDQLIHLDDLALFAIEFFQKNHAENLRLRYKLTEEEMDLPPVELLLLITKKAGFRDDYERGSELIVNELRSGKLGAYTLDLYESNTENSEDADNHRN